MSDEDQQELKRYACGPLVFQNTIDRGQIGDCEKETEIRVSKPKNAHRYCRWGQTTRTRQKDRPVGARPRGRALRASRKRKTSRSRERKNEDPRRRSPSASSRRERGSYTRGGSFTPRAFARIYRIGPGVRGEAASSQTRRRRDYCGLEHGSEFGIEVFERARGAEADGAGLPRGAAALDGAPQIKTVRRLRRRERRDDLVAKCRARKVLNQRALVDRHLAVARHDPHACRPFKHTSRLESTL